LGIVTRSGLFIGSVETEVVISEKECVSVRQSVSQCVTWNERICRRCEADRYGEGKWSTIWKEIV